MLHSFVWTDQFHSDPINTLHAVHIANIVFTFDLHFILMWIYLVNSGFATLQRI